MIFHEMFLLKSIPEKIFKARREKTLETLLKGVPLKFSLETTDKNVYFFVNKLKWVE